MTMMGRTMIGAALAAALAAVPAAAQTVWTGYTYVPSATLASYKGMEQLAAEMAKAANNAVQIRMNVGGSLPINIQNITQAVGDGVAQIAADGFFVGNVPMGGILRLPMLLNTEAEFEKAVAAIRPHLDRAFERRGVVVLAHYYYPLQVSFSSQKLTQLEDLSGQKMRVTSPEQGEFVRRFGGVPITIGGPEVPSALQSGAVSGVFTASSGGGRLWKEQLKFNYRLGPNFFNSVIIANKDAYDRLPAGQRHTIKDLGEKHAKDITAALKREEAEVTEQLKAGGMTITEPTQKQIETAMERMRPFWDEWAAKQPAEVKAAFAEVRAAIGR